MVALFLLALSLALRLPALDAMVNVDMYHLWTPRIVRFWSGVTHVNFAATYQTHHPGVTFMWMAGGLWQLFAATTSGPLDPQRLSLATIPIALIGSAFPAVTYLLMRRLLHNGRDAVATLTGLLIATEPLFIAHSCNAHLDMLVTSFAWTSLLCAILTLRKNSYRYAAASGGLLGLALLTKLSAAGFALGIVLVFLVAACKRRARPLPLVRLLGCITVVAGLTVIALWPALWVAPLATLSKLVRGLTYEVDKASSFMFLGQTGRLRLPSSIYGVFALFLATPEAVLPVILGGVSLFCGVRIGRPLAWQLTLGALPLALLLGGGSRIGVRYLLPLLPWIATVSALVLVNWHRYLTLRYARRLGTALGLVTIGLLLAGRLARIYTLFPLPITYCSAWTGIDCSDVFHLGWGEGLKEAALYVEGHQRTHFGKSPIVVYGSSYASTLGVWTRVKSTRDINDAALLIDYITVRQRRLPQALEIERYVADHHSQPLHEVVLQGRTYARIFAGPKY